jgi:hypothetical protein
MLQEFLIQWTGTPEEFQPAFEEASQGMRQAREALRTQLASNIKKVKSPLTAAQFEALTQVGPEAPHPGFGGQGPPPRGPNGPPDRDHRGGPRNELGRPPALFADLDLLHDVLTAKIEALQRQ